MLRLVMLLATVRLLRAAPTQCVTLMPGYVWPEWRVVVSIIHRFHEFFLVRRCLYPR